MLGFLRYFLIAALFGIAFSLKATHNRAGEITYKWISGYTYSITLTTYTDDGPSIADRCKLTIYFGDGDSCQAIRQNGASSVSTAECPTSFAGVLIKTSPNIKENIYSCTHTYNSAGNYKIYMFDRNRNSGVINIPNSVNQPFYIETFLLISPFLGPNNSSVLTIKPIDEAALFKCFYHNAGAYDSDGDSLSYEIITCKGEDAMGNIGQTIPGYSFPAYGTGGYFKIDSLTGTLSWCNPQSNGEYNIAIRIKEWRKSGCSGSSTLIGYVTRDMQIIVQNALNNPPQFSVTTNTCVQAGNVLTSVINTSDPETNMLTITATGSPFSLSTATISTFTSANASAAFSWTTTCSDIRKQNHTAYFKVIDNGAPVELSNFLVYDISVIAPAPQNLNVGPGPNFMQLWWNKPACHPVSGNKIDHYNIYRVIGSSSWAHSACEKGVPASSGLSYLWFTATENDTAMTDYSVSSFTNGTTFSYAVVAVYKDCSESYASAVASNQLAIGIDEKTKTDFNVNVFPNPSSGSIKIELTTLKPGNFSLELYDVNGRKIKQLNTTFVADKTNFEFDIKEFENGYYILKINNEGKSCSYKPLIKI